MKKLLKEIIGIRRELVGLLSWVLLIVSAPWGLKADGWAGVAYFVCTWLPLIFVVGRYLHKGIEKEGEDLWVKERVNLHNSYAEGMNDFAKRL